jgi:hypothetical protein
MLVYLSVYLCYIYTGRFVMFSVVTNIYNKKTKGPTLMELFTATRKVIFFLQLEMFGLCRKLARTRSTSSSAVNGRPLDFRLHRHPLSVNCLYHARMVLSVGRSFAWFTRNACCTETKDLLVWYSNTQNDFSPGADIFSIHTLASPSGRNMNYDEKNVLGKIFFSCSFYLYRFRKYVSYGFPTINFCNHGVHYERPCVYTCFIDEKLPECDLRRIRIRRSFYGLYVKKIYNFNMQCSCWYYLMNLQHS